MVGTKVLTSGMIRTWDYGSANMAVLTTPDISLGRFWVPGQGGARAARLAGIQVHFSAGTGTADLQLVRQSPANQPLEDFVLHTFWAVGTGYPIFKPIPISERSLFIFEPDEQACLVWTNPNSGTMRWTAQLTWEPY